MKRALATLVTVLLLSAWTPTAGAAEDRCFGHAPTVVGTSGNDTLEGTDGRDVIIALKGDDVIRTLGGDDLVCAGWGTDRIYGGGGNDKLYGDDGPDRLFGGAGNDNLDGAWLSDRLYGGSGDDVLDGGVSTYVTFKDLAVYDPSSSPVIVDLAAGTARGDDIGSDTLVNISGAVGTSGADVLMGDDASNQLIGGLGDDSIDGRAGDDSLFGGMSKSTHVTNDGADSISGGPGNDDITGGYGTDSLEGGEGDDTLASDWKRNTDPTAEVGGTLSGDAGDDTLMSGPGNDTLDGGLGVDLASFENAPAGVTVDLGRQMVQGDGMDQMTSIESARGTPFTDELVGSDGPDSLDGVWGSDVIRGLGGDDKVGGDNWAVGQLVVDGGDGKDVLFGGATCFGPCGPEYEGRASFFGGDGDDIFRSAPSGYAFDGGAGNDTVAYDFFYGAEDHYVGTHVDLASGQAWINEPKCPGGPGCFVDTLISVENADGGMGQDELIGDGNPNVLRGIDDDDILRGAGGNDLLDGGDGNDTLDGGPGEDVCTGESTRDCEG